MSSRACPSGIGPGSGGRGNGSVCITHPRRDRDGSGRAPFALLALKVRRLVLQSLRCAGLPCPHLPAPRDPCRCRTGPAPFSTRRRSVQLDEVQHSGEWTAQQLAPAAISGQLRSRRIASPIALPPPSVSSTTSTATRHHQATPKYLVASAIPTAAPRHWSYPAVPSSNLIPDRRLLLGVRVRSCLAWSDAGSGQWTVDRAPSLRPKKKSERSNSQKSEPLPRCQLSTLHRDRPMLPQPSPNPSNAPVPVLRITACLSSSQAVVACRRRSPVARHSPVSLASHTLLHAPATPSPPSTVHPRASQLSQQPAIIPRAHPRHRPSQRTATATTLPPREGL